MSIQVAAAIICENGKYLVARRKQDTHLGGLWEFPGGKRESGETLEHCLKRELQEELGVEIGEPTQWQIIQHAYPEKTVELHFFQCRINRGHPMPLACDEIRWVTKGELATLPLPEADKGIVESLIRGEGERGRNGIVTLPFPLEARLKDGTPVELVLAGREEVEPLRRLYRVIVEEGTSYPHDRMPGPEDFFDYWFRSKSTITAHVRGRPDREMIGAFYLKSNWPGRARHVANAGFIVAPAWRNRGLGWLLGAAMLDYAKRLGYRSVIFNLVFAKNQPALHLWNKLGFEELSRIAGAVLNDDGSYQDAVIMFRSLI